MVMSLAAHDFNFPPFFVVQVLSRKAQALCSPVLVIQAWLRGQFPATNEKEAS